MQKDIATLDAKKVRVVGVSYDAVDVLSDFAGKQKISFPLLADPDSVAIEAFGLLNPDAKGRIAGVPYPGTMIIDSKGTICAKLFVDGYRDRHATADIIRAIDAVK